MRCFFCLLFLPGVLCPEYSGVSSSNNPFQLWDRNPIALRAWHGSCVVIPCNIKRNVGRQSLDIISLIWYFGPVYIKALKEFDGTMLYNVSRNPPNHMSTTSPTFEGRVRFVGDLEQRNCNLKISRLRKNDSGVYLPRLYGLLEGTPELNKWGLEIQVNVMELPPKPKMEIMPQKIKENQSTQVICSVPYHCPDEPLMLSLSGLEEHGMFWRKTTEIDKIQATLTFVPTWKDHGKTLKCLLSRQDGSMISESALLLNVDYAPKGLVLRATPRATIQEGEKLSLECTVNSSNPSSIQYRWYKDDVETYEWTGHKIEFNSVEEHNAGTYKCEVRNTVGTDIKKLSIDVQYLPKETRVDVTPQVIEEGARVVLKCSSRGNPPIDHWQWYKSPQHSPYRTGLELRFDAIRPNNSGTYYCVAQNRLGNSSFTPVKLNVLYPPKNVKLANQNPLSILEGDTVKLNCSVDSSNPPVNQYKWFTSPWDKTERGNPLIFRATRRDAGSYRCEACNSVRCIPSTPIHVDVLYVPKEVNVVQEPMGRIREGTRVQMRCHVGAANPKELTYVWYKDHQQLQLPSADATRILSKVMPGDSGTYSCEARNSVGKSWSSAVTLDVLYGPHNVYVSLSVSEAITEGMDLKMLCQSNANPAPNYYEWYWDKEWRPFENSRILALPKVQVKQSGVYRCRAKNIISLGESEPLYLTVSLSGATVLKRTLISLGTAFGLLLFLGVLGFGLRNWKKEIDPRAGHTRRPSFFVKKAKREKLCHNNRSNEGPTEPPLRFQNQGAETDISYATIRFPPSFSEERTEYACIKGSTLAMVPADDAVIYSVVTKPCLPTKGDAKHDYENVRNNQEEEIHYSSLVNLAQQPCPTYRDSDTDSESEESIQYASLKQ